VVARRGEQAERRERSAADGEHADDRRTKPAYAARLALPRKRALAAAALVVRGDEPDHVERRRPRNRIAAQRALRGERATALDALIDMRVDAGARLDSEKLQAALVEHGRNVVAVHRDSPEIAAIRGG